MCDVSVNFEDFPGLPEGLVFSSGGITLVITPFFLGYKNRCIVRDIETTSRKVHTFFPRL